MAARLKTIEFSSEVAVPDEPSAEAVLVPGKPFMVYPLGNHIGLDGRPFRMTESHASKLVESAKKRTQDIPILYEHGKDNTKGFVAAGWAKPSGIELRSDGVWATIVEWSRDAYRDIKDKVRRYISGSAYGDYDTDGVFFPDSFREITLTNVPNFTSLPPVEASAEGDEEMDAKTKTRLAKFLGLDPEKASEDDFLKAMDELEAEEIKLAAAEKLKADAPAAEPVKELVAASSVTPEKLQEMVATGIAAARKADEVNALVDRLSREGKLLSEKEKKAALAMASADFEGFKTLAEGMRPKHTGRQLISATASDGKPLQRHSSDFIGPMAEVDEERLPLHHAALAHMTSTGEKSYTKAVLAVSR